MNSPAGALPRRDVIVVEGMFCAACAASVEATLARQPGVGRAAVNFAADAAVIEWTDDTPDRNAVLDAIDRLGYRPRLLGDDREARGHADPARGLMLRLIIAVFFGMWTMLPAIVLYLGVAGPDVAYGLALAAGAFSLPVVLYSGVPFYRMGWATLRSGVAGIDALITIGVIGSVVLSAINLASGSAAVYVEVAVALITLQLIARLLDYRIRRTARDAVTGLLELAPTDVTLIGDDGSERRVAPGDVAPGALLRVRPGERLALDGIVREGVAGIDASLLSGESRPLQVAVGDTVNAGVQLLDGALLVEVTAAAGKRRIDALARQVRQMLASKPAWQQQIETLARGFLWVSALIAVIAAALVLGTGGSATEAAVRALAVFVIACPCALSLAAPLTGLAASAAAARRGVILRDLSAITHSARPNLLFTDKTGTLTAGRPSIVNVHVLGDTSKADLLALAAAAERGSEHPVGRAIASAATPAPISGTLRATSGGGVTFSGDDLTLQLGSPDWFRTLDIDASALPATDLTRVLVARDGKCIGAIDLDDTLRPGVANAVKALRRDGIVVVMLSGDAEGPVRRVANLLDIEGRAGCSPEAKIAAIESAQSAGQRVAFAGDGLNDGPALAAADIGIAVGDATDAARTAAAITLEDADFTALPDVFRLTRRARRIIRQNLAWAVIYNAVAIPLAMAGFVEPVIAAVAMAASSISIALNAWRAGAADTRT